MIESCKVTEVEVLLWVLSPRLRKVMVWDMLRSHTGVRGSCFLLGMVVGVWCVRTGSGAWVLAERRRRGSAADVVDPRVTRGRRARPVTLMAGSSRTVVRSVASEDKERAHQILLITST